MRIVQINATCGAGSTGKICLAISELLTQRGIENYLLYSIGKSEHPLGIKTQTKAYTKLQALFSRVCGNWGFNAYLSTKKMLRQLSRIKPDAVYLHNLHSHNCNLRMLFRYLKERKIKVTWVFHDCWAFTGYCMYFDRVGCEKWKTGCGRCPQKKEYSWFFDKSRRLWEEKRALLSGIDLTVITPSSWLGELVKQSFLKDCPIRVVNNGIDLTVFKPTPSDFKKKHGLEGKRVVLGVAFGWGERKGLDTFAKLAEQLPADYRVALVGTEKSDARHLPESVLCLPRTADQTVLAEIYTAADVFVNPTREENYPTVNMEALACGTPVVTFRTGGSPEIIDESCGIAVEKDDLDGLLRAVLRAVESGELSAERCVAHAAAFDQNKHFEQYIRYAFKDTTSDTEAERNSHE